MATVDVTLPPAGATPPAEGTPPPEGTSPPAGGDGNEELSIEQAQTLIEQLRTENTTLSTDRDRWKSTSRKNERELTKLKGSATPPAEGAGGQPPATPASSTDAELRALRLEVALDLGLPKALALRLQGDDEESIREDAEELRKLIPATPAPPRVPGSGDGGSGGAPPVAAKSFGDKIREAAGIRAVTF